MTEIVLMTGLLICMHTHEMTTDTPENKKQAYSCAITYAKCLKNETVQQCIAKNYDKIS